MSKQIVDNSEMDSPVVQFEQLAKTIQSFKNEQAILVSFVSVLLAAVNLLEQEKDKLVNQHIHLSRKDCDVYEEIANLYQVIAYNCEHNEPSPDEIEFAQLCHRIENLFRAIVQHSKGCIDRSQGYFHASEANLSQLCEDSLQAIEATNTKEPITFTEIH